MSRATRPLLAGGATASESVSIRYFGSLSRAVSLHSLVTNHRGLTHGLLLVPGGSLPLYTMWIRNCIICAWDVSQHVSMIHRLQSTVKFPIYIHVHCTCTHCGLSVLFMVIYQHLFLYIHTLFRTLCCLVCLSFSSSNSLLRWILSLHKEWAHVWMCVSDTLSPLIPPPPSICGVIISRFISCTIMTGFTCTTHTVPLFIIMCTLKARVFFHMASL